MNDRYKFMENEDWYEYDFEKRMWVLTDKAPEEAKKSYEKYLKDKKDPNLFNG